MSKSERELAFLHDLYIAPDWGERFADLIDQHIKLPAKGRVLYVAAGTGTHTLSLQEKGGAEIDVIGVDESEEKLNIARAKATAMKSLQGAKFAASQLETLEFGDDEFAAVIGDASLVAPERVPEMLAEMIRVAAPGATVALNLTTAASFGEFFSIYWEALSNTDLLDSAAQVEDLIKEQRIISDAEELATNAGLDDVESWTQKEEFTFASGEEFLNSPLVADFLLERWLELLPAGDAAARNRVKQEIVRLVDEERSEIDFVLSIKATLVKGRKPKEN